MAVPYIFATATSSIPLSQLDTDLATPITIGNTAVQLGNTITTLYNMTLSNVTITSGTANVTANVTFSNANAVVYTNSSNVATTSTALTFNGTRLAVGGSAQSIGNAEVVGNGISSGLTIVSATSNGYNGRFYVDTTASTVNIWTGKLGAGNGYPIAFSIDGIEQMRLTSTGLGIGTSSPATKLDVVGAINATSNITSGGVLQALTTVQSSSGADLSLNANGANRDIIYKVNSTELMRLVGSTGNLGIGTSSPGQKLHVAGNITSDAWIGRSNISAPSADCAIYRAADNTLAFSTASTERARITSVGNLLINNTYTTSSKLIVAGDGTSSAAYAGVFCDSGGVTILSMRNDGYIDTGTRAVSPYNNTTASAANMFVDSTGGLFRSTSSLKYKTDVQDATHGLAEVMKLRSVTYKGKKDGDTVFGGLIAEEVHSAGLTEFVQYAEDGSPDALAYGNMVSLLTKAIQEQQAMINELKAEVAALKAK